jgi:hypothetical protein
MKPLFALTFTLWLLGWVLPSWELVAWTSVVFIVLAWALVGRHILRAANGPYPGGGRLSDPHPQATTAIQPTDGNPEPLRYPSRPAGTSLMKLGPLLRMGGAIK